jgi:hypothetical protein
VLNIDVELADIENMKMWQKSLMEEANVQAERDKLGVFEEGVQAQKAKVRADLPACCGVTPPLPGQRLSPACPGSFPPHMS